MMGVKVSSNAARVLADFGRVRREIRDKAIMRSLNRALDMAATSANRNIRKTYSVSAKAVRSAFFKRRASMRTSGGRATLNVSGARIKLIGFAARQMRAGVSVKVKKAEGRKLIPRAFIAKMKSGHKGVFVRVSQTKPDLVFRYGPGSRSSSKGNDLPIAELDTLSLPVAFSQKQVLAAIDKDVAEAFETAMDHNLRYLLMPR